MALENGSSPIDPTPFPDFRGIERGSIISNEKIANEMGVSQADPQFQLTKLKYRDLLQEYLEREGLGRVSIRSSLRDGLKVLTAKEQLYYCPAEIRKAFRQIRRRNNEDQGNDMKQLTSSEQQEISDRSAHIASLILWFKKKMPPAFPGPGQKQIEDEPDEPPEEDPDDPDVI